MVQFVRLVEAFMKDFGGLLRQNPVVECIRGRTGVGYPVRVEVEKVVAEIPEDALDWWYVGFRKFNDVASFDLGLQEQNPQD